MLKVLLILASAYMVLGLVLAILGGSAAVPTTPEMAKELLVEVVSAPLELVLELLRG